MKRFAFFVLSGLLLTSPAFAALHDLQIALEDIALEPANPIAKQPVRIYATVRNVGTRDTEATIEFYDGDRKIGSKAVSVRTGGRPDEMWMLWTPVSEGNHLLRVRLVSDSDTPDENADNNVIILDTYADVDTDGDNVPNRVDLDDDNDGALDTKDQFPLDATRSKDTDGDGIDDKIDTDLDNDGLSNEEEVRLSTDPLRRDTDGDGVGDKEDFYPLDPKRWMIEPIKILPKTVVTPTPLPSTPLAVSRVTTAPAQVTVTQLIATASRLVSLPSYPPMEVPQPMMPDVLGTISVSATATDDKLTAQTSTSTTVSVLNTITEPRRQISEIVAAQSARDEDRDGVTIPVLAGLAVVTGGIGVGFLLKSRML